MKKQKEMFVLMQGYETRDGCLGELRGYNYSPVGVVSSIQKAREWVSEDHTNREAKKVPLLDKTSKEEANHE